MTWPLVILAFFSVVGGMLMFWWIQTWLQPPSGTTLTNCTLILGACRAGRPWWSSPWVSASGWYFFGRPEVTIPIEAPKANAFVTMGRNDAYADAIMDVAVVQPYAALGRGIVGADAHLVDAGFMGMGTLLQGVSESLRKLQTGYVRTYALTMTAGVLLVGLVMILSRMG